MLLYGGMHLHANNRVVVLRHAQDHVIDNDAYHINVRQPRHRCLKRPEASRGRGPQLSNQPPSTSTVVPVTKSFLIRNKIADATSSAVPGRGIRWLAVAPDNSC